MIKLITILVVLGCALHRADPHIVFDQVGSYAGAVSFVHTAINLDFSSIQVAVAKTELAISNYDKEVARFMKPKLGLTGNPIYHHYLKQNQTYSRLARNRDIRLHLFKTKLENTIKELPETLERQKRDLSAANIITAAAKPAISQAAKFLVGTAHTNALGITTSIATMLAKGAIGSFDSWFTADQITNIKTRLNTLTSVFTSHDQQLKETVDLANDLPKRAVDDDLFQALQAYSDFDTAMDLLDQSLERVLNAFRELQDQHLSIDLLSADQLSDLFNRLKDIAIQKGTELLIAKPSDLFQLQTSYLYDGYNVVVLLHVPMIPHNSLLRLMKIRPFPIPVTNDHSLMPTESSDLLALSNSNPPQWTIVSQYSLIDCHKVNSIYVCPGNGILHHHMKKHCLGALYMEDITLAKQICDLDVIPEQEQVLQLEDDRFLIYSTKPQDITLFCPNIPNEIKRLKEGISTEIVPFGCTLGLANTTIYSQFELRLKAQLKHYAWDRATIEEFHITEADIEETKKNLPESRKDRIHISEIIERKKRFLGSMPLSAIAISALAGALSFGVASCLLGIIIFIRNKRHNNDHHNKNAALEERLDRLKAFAEDRLQRLQGNLSVRLPTPPMDIPAALDALRQHV
jgi:hypothetical protein